MKRTSSYLRAVVPAMNEWAVKSGDMLRVFSPAGDPSDPATDLSEAYIVPEPFVLQPSYFTGFIAVELFTCEEINILKSSIEKNVSEELILEIYRAINEFVCTIALRRRLSTWKDIEKQLLLILRKCETVIGNAHELVELTDWKSTDDSVSRGVPSADQLVKKMIMDQVRLSDCTLKIDLGAMIGPIKQALDDIKPKMKRGRKPENVFRLFLSRLKNAMNNEGWQLRVPSNDSVLEHSHPTFKFVTTLLDICVEKGKSAIRDSELDDTEKADAVRELSQYRKSQRALVHYFRDGLPS